MLSLFPRILIAALLCISAFRPASGQTEALAVPQQTKSYHVRRVDGADVRIDGRLDEPVWQTLAPIDGFVQTQPTEGAPVSERTEVRVFFDENAIYFGFKCYDSDPGHIIARYGPHDGRTNSDSVDILLDTFHDRRTGFYFSINSRGIQYDGLMNEGEGSGRDDNPFQSLIDGSWDGIWYSAAVVENWGWSAEIAIPFKSVRVSRAPEQVWGMNLCRDIVRKDETSCWVLVTRYDQVMKPSKAGVLTGLADVEVGRNIELIPYVRTKYRQADWQAPVAGADGTGGLDLRYGMAANLTANLTLNPDFGETEADEFTSEISRFEIFFPEKRKFFTEGSNYFQTPMDLFFTRRVGARLPDGEPQRILQGGKLTGKAGAWTIGALEALTQRTEYTDPATRLQLVAPAAFFGVLRLQHDILQKSALGFISVNRLQGTGGLGYQETAHGVDLQLLKGQHITWASQVMVNTNSLYPGLGGQHLGWQSTFHYNADLLEYGAQGKFLGRNTDLSFIGFEPETDRRSGDAYIRYKPFINRWGIRQIIGELNYDQSNGTRGEFEDAGADATLNVQFKNFWSLQYEHSYNRVRWFEFTPEFARLDSMRVYNTPIHSFQLSTNENRAINASLGYETRKLVEFFENFYGYSQQYTLSSTAKLGGHLRWELNGVWQSESLVNRRHYQDRRFAISRWTYQFTPKLRTRILAQYSDDIHGSNVSINSLFAYDFTARSALFVGYNRQRRSPLDFTDLGNEFFIKLSYLFSY